METREQLQKAGERIKPSNYADVKIFLRHLYEHMVQKAAHYTYRLFARDLGFGETTVIHQIVKGYRPLTLPTARRIALALQLKGTEKEYFLKLAELRHARDRGESEESLDRLLQLKHKVLPNHVDRDVLQYLSEWYHPVVREIVGCEGYVDEPRWIAERILPKLRVSEVKKSLDLLERLGLLMRDPETGKRVQTQKRLSTGHRIAGMALLHFHEEMLTQSRQALLSVPAERRNIQCLTVSCSEAKAQKLKEMVNLFLTQVLDEAEAEEGEQVYQLNVQLFPMTK